MDSTSSSGPSSSRSQVQRNPLDPRIEFKWGASEYPTRIHAHREFSIGAVIEGRTKIHLANHCFHLEAGHFIAIPPELPHLCQPDPHSSFQFCMIYLDPSLLGEYEVLERIHPYLQAVQAGPVEGSSLMDLGHQCVSIDPAKGLSPLLQRISQFLSQSTLCWECEVRIPFTTECVSKLDQLEQKGKSSRYQVYRAHRHQYGLGQQGVRQIQRIERSKQMLRQGLSVARTAVDCGFFDQSHYTRSFRLYTGLTPSRYRKGR